MKAGLHRLQLDVSPAMRDLIDALRDRVDAGSRAEVVRRALNLLHHATDPKGKLVLVAPDGSERILTVV